MKQCVPIILLFLILFQPYNAVLSQELDFPSSTRSLAMGNSYLTITDLKNMVYFNPAALGFNERTYLSLDIRVHDYSFSDNFYHTPYNNSEIALSTCLIKNRSAFAFSYRRKGNKYDEDIYMTLPESKKKTKGLYHEYYLVIYRGKKLSKNLSVGSTLWLLQSATESFRDGFFSRNTFSSTVNIATILELSESILFALQVQNPLKFNWRYVILDYYGNRKYLKRLPLRIHIAVRVKRVLSTIVYVEVRDAYSEPVRNGYSFNPSFHIGLKRRLIDIATVYVGYQVSKFRKNFFLFPKELSHLFSSGMSIEYKNFTLDLAMVLGDRAKTIREFEVGYQGDVIHYIVSGSGTKLSVTLGYTF